MLKSAGYRARPANPDSGMAPTSRPTTRGDMTKREVARFNGAILPTNYRDDDGNLRTLAAPIRTDGRAPVTTAADSMSARTIRERQDAERMAQMARVKARMQLARR